MLRGAKTNPPAGAEERLGAKEGASLRLPSAWTQSPFFGGEGVIACHCAKASMRMLSIEIEMKGCSRVQGFGKIESTCRHGPTSSRYWNAIALAICAR